MKDLEQVFDKLKQHNLTLKPSKCHFAAKQVDYLGHVISKHGTKPNPNKTAVIDTYPVPKDKTQVRRFTGMSNFYRRFIRAYSQLVYPLNHLLKNDTDWEWSAECDKAFVEIKRQLVTAPMLAYPDTAKEFILTTDASRQALGYILSQKDETDKERVIAYGDRALRKSERNYPVTELEGLAIIEGIKAYHPYIANSHFTIITDHIALKYLMNVKADTGRIARWALALQGYDFNVIHRKGLVNRNADALSRREYDIEEELVTTPDTPPFIDMLPMETVSTVFCYESDEHGNDMACSDPMVQATVTIASLVGTTIGEAQIVCPDIGPIYNYVLNNELPEDDKLARKIVLESDQYGMRNDTLYHIFSPRTKGVLRMDTLINQVVVPVKLRCQILSEYHDSLVGGGHQGFDRTYYAIKSKYYWNGMYADVDKYVRQCRECQHAKRMYHGQPVPLHPLPVAAVFQRWHMDFLGPLKKAEDGEQYILLIVDSFSRWCEAFAVKDQKATTVAKVLYEQIFTRYGAPRELISDRGSQFMSKLVAALCGVLSQTICTSAYHPQTNSTCEGMNSTIGQALRAYVKDDQSDWPSMLPGILMAYRMTPAMRSTEFSPYFLVFGHEMLTPIDTEMVPPENVPKSYEQHLTRTIENLHLARTLATENVHHNVERSKAAYDLKARDPNFTVGQTVLLYVPRVMKGDSAKLQRKWQGPYYIVECCNNHTYSLRHAETHVLHKSLVHANLLKPYCEREHSQLCDNDITLELETEPVGETEEQHGQDNLTVINETINRPANHSNDNDIMPDHSQSGNTQRTIERVMCSRCYRGKLWYRVKWLNVRKGDWVEEDIVPKEMQRDYFVKYTMAGRAKKKKRLELTDE